MNNKKIFLSIFLILFLVSISSVSAEDLSTSLDDISEANNDIKEMEINTDDTQEVSTTNDDGKVGEGDDIYAQTMYFNASSATDGDGSRNNPFKYVTDARLPYGVTAYFANGVYEIDSAIDLYSNDYSSKVTFYGESTDGVIFKCTNSSSVAFFVNDMSRCYMYNMTFDNAVIQNRGTLEANGVVFKNGIAVDTTASSYPTRNNAFGGAIYSPGSIYYAGYGMKSYLTLNNCIFMNNSAVYGGSIYHKNGITVIRNTKFYNSYASLYGGALATDAGEIQIENCEFINCHADGDAGGAIYSKVTDLTVKDSNFENGIGDFGGAICNLNSNLIIENSKFKNNSAKYEGGAIYAMYGNVVISDCEITKNSALDGGAVFVDNCTSVNVAKTTFDKNSAKRYGGTIFSNGQAASLDDATLKESSAPIGQVIYHQDKYDYDIGYNSDYQMMVYNSSYNGVLPSKYDLRDYGFVTPVRDQEGGGNCWAFAGIAALESCILKATGKEIDLSEENVKNLIELYSAYGWKMDTNDGGHSEMTWGNLISWLGPVLESDDPYDDYSTLSTLMDAFMHVQNVYYLPARTSTSDNDAIKKAIMDYGAVSALIFANFDSPLYFDKTTASYFNYVKGAYANHAVTVVGWDDNYDKNKFPMGSMADGNGAWIVKNSWNTDWGDEGYFYVSYSDFIMFEVGEKNVAYTFILNDTVRYNRNYQYDIGGMTDYLYPIGNNQTLYYKNTFNAIGNDILTAVSTIFEDAIDYEISIFINDEFKHSQTGHSFAGYATIPLTKEYQLTAGDKFTVQFKISKTGGASIPICEVVTATRLTYSEGISFFSTDGTNWNDLYTFTLDRPDIEHRYASQVACIKAFTRSSGETLKTTLSLEGVEAVAGETARVTATVKDENGKLINTGYVTFDIGGVKQSIKVSNGYAVLETVFSSQGTFSIYATYSGVGYDDSQASANAVVSKAQPKSTVITVPDVEYVHGQDGIVKITLTDSNGKAIGNVNIKLTVNGNTNVQKTNSNGVATFNMDLAVGNHSATVEFEGNELYINSSKTLSINVLDETSHASQTTIVVSDVNYNYGNSGIVTATLSDLNGNAISYVNLKLTINNIQYSSQTNANGIATFNLNNLAVGTYTATVEFEGNAAYLKSSNTLTVRVLSNSQSVGDTVNVIYSSASNGIVTAIITDEEGRAVVNTEVSLNIGGKTYTTTSNNNGIATFKVDLNGGVYQANIIVNGKTVSSDTSKTINVINNQIPVDETIIAEDSIRAEGSSYDFKATFYDLNGNPLSEKEINFIINGNDYFVKTDEYGVARLSNGLSANSYSITMINPATGAILTKNATIVNRIIGNKNINIDYTKSATYKVQLYADNGQIAGAGENVVIKIGSSTYNVKTDSKGYASVVISGLTPKTYTVTAEYKGVKVSNKIVVKQVLTAKNAKFKRYNVKKYSATLKVNGKALKGKKITFKINGKTYKAKTNAKGIASIKIKSLFKIGKHKIKITYLKSSITKTVTVKR